MDERRLESTGNRYSLIQVVPHCETGRDRCELPTRSSNVNESCKSLSPQMIAICSGGLTVGSSPLTSRGSARAVIRDDAGSTAIGAVLRRRLPNVLTRSEGATLRARRLTNIERDAVTGSVYV